MSVIAITYPLDLPASPAPVETDIQLQYAIAEARSPFTFAGQVQDWGGRVWTARVTLPPMLRAAADEWLVWCSKLRGRYGYFRMGDWDRRTPRGAGGGTPLVNGAAQTGNGLATDGWPNATTVLRAGDHVQIENRLYRVVADATSNGAGQATLQIEPDLRAAPADNAALTISSPKGLWRLTENALSNPTDPAGMVSFAFTAMEKLP